MITVLMNKNELSDYSNSISNITCVQRSLLWHFLSRLASDAACGRDSGML